MSSPHGEPLRRRPGPSRPAHGSVRDPARRASPRGDGDDRRRRRFRPRSAGRSVRTPAESRTGQQSTPPTRWPTSDSVSCACRRVHCSMDPHERASQFGGGVNGWERHVCGVRRLLGGVWVELRTVERGGPGGGLSWGVGGPVGSRHRRGDRSARLGVSREIARRGDRRADRAERLTGRRRRAATGRSGGRSRSTPSSGAR
jgi:hypothetical protein